MTEGQEIRAKAMEIAALILGERHNLETYLPPKIDLYGDMPAVEMINYDATLAHYIRLADAVDPYIRGDGED
jgi:hypothetical protein